MLGSPSLCRADSELWMARSRAMIIWPTTSYNNNNNNNNNNKKKGIKS